LDPSFVGVTLKRARRSFVVDYREASSARTQRDSRDGRVKRASLIMAAFLVARLT